MKKIILASTSPRRKEILEQIGLEFDIVPSSYKEDMSVLQQPEELAKYLAKQKGKAVSHVYDGASAVIISADTLVAVNGYILGKPSSKEHARQMLQKLSNSTHHVYTGVCIIDTELQESTVFSSSAAITMRNLSANEIDRYIETGEPMDKAGGYGIQGIASMFVTSIEGDYYSIVGLPVQKVVSVLRRYGIKILM